MSGRARVYQIPALRKRPTPPEKRDPPSSKVPEKVRVRVICVYLPIPWFGWIDEAAGDMEREEWIRQSIRDALIKRGVWGRGFSKGHREAAVSKAEAPL